jgi:MFS family permease
MSTPVLGPQPHAYPRPFLRRLGICLAVFAISASISLLAQRYNRQTLAVAGFGLAVLGMLTAHVLLWHQFGRLMAGEMGARIGLIGGLTLAGTFVAGTLGNALAAPWLQEVGEFTMPVLWLLLLLAVGAVVWQVTQWVRRFRDRAR